MKKIHITGVAMVITVMTTAFISGCTGREEKKRKMNIPITECIVKTTPVKDQGKSSLCWAYAMLATIESDRLTMGDSVNLSPHYVARKLIEEQVETFYLTRGTARITTRGTAPMLLKLIMKYGLTHYDAYNTDANFNVVGRKAEKVALTAVKRQQGLDDLHRHITDIFDENMKSEPKQVYMLGAEYTPLQFARSVCREGEYAAMTSYTHHPFGESFILEVPDNKDCNMFINVPIDTLTARVEQALRNGNAVCWEGDISSPGFSFTDGIARLEDEKTPVTQEMRQREFETFKCTDDHCMEIIGIARGRHGKKLFICKNSWGTDNPFGGLMYMTENYLRLNTVAVVMKRH